MTTVAIAPPALTGDLILYHTTDPFLSNAPILIFHGPAATVGAASARIQFHVFTIAGHASYPRLAISPNSPFYSAVTNLPRDEQGDELCRGIAFGLKKYFEELPQEIKRCLSTQGKSQKLFNNDHIAILASRLNKIENRKEVTADLIRSFAEQKVSWLDLDVVLPPGTINEPPKRSDSTTSEDLDGDQILVQQYGKYSKIVAAFGDSAFLPTSSMKRAPSKVSSIGRTASFLRQQKQNARKEVDELLATEQSYVSRLRELELIAMDAEKSAETASIFPSSISKIQHANETFMLALENIVNATSESSRSEIDSMVTEHPTAQQIRQDFLADNQGIVAVAKCLCEKLPSFRDCYTEYLQDHTAAITQLKSVLHRDDLVAKGLVQKIGEQKLTSLLIEPVQRLPRYALYIDGMSKQLPAKHPALKHLLKAKDLVTELCASETQSTTIASIDERLQSRTAAWPSDLHITGRLITAVDFIELAPPFDLDKSFIQSGMLLLFTDSIVLLERQGEKPITARTFMTELESALSTHKSTSSDLVFHRHLPLDSITFTESHEGQSLRLTSFDGSNIAESVSTLLLESQYEGKAARLVEEIVKAKVEARFSEIERESYAWEVRATESSAGELRLFSAIFQDTNQEHINQRQGSASIRVIVDIDKHSRKPRAGKDGVESIVTISSMRDGNYRLSIDAASGHNSSEQVSAVDLAVVLRRKLALLLTIKHASGQPALAALTLKSNKAVLDSLTLTEAVAEEPEAVAVEPASKHQWSNPLRPVSPVKMLSNLFSSSTGPGSQLPPLRKEPSGTSLVSAGSSFNMQPPSAPQNTAGPPSRDSRPTSSHSRPKSSSSVQSFGGTRDPGNGLEGTFSAYILAMKARKGNIVGRNLKMRHTADELAINELYNTLLNNHQMMVTAAQAPVDILFAAFEKFLRLAWREQRGAIMPISLLQDIQTKAQSQFPSNFDQYLKTALHTLPSHNQKAFKAIINLLNDLLDGTGNDADRGALTAAFTELLVDDDPHQYIGLIDRFVDGVETYFGEPLAEIDHSDAGFSTHKRSRSVNTGSITSNTSSLRKKFGLSALSRENSRSESDGKNSVWRTLSKSRSRAESPADISHGSLHRARSTDSENRSQSRPVSQDGSARKPQNNDNLTVPTMNANVLPGLTTIGEHPSFIPMGPPRKKRRSSLSDLKALDTPFVTPLRVAKSPQSNKQNLDRSVPASPISSSPSSKGGSLRITSPPRSNTRPALPPSFLKSSPSASNVLDRVSSTSKQETVSNENEAPPISSPTKIRQLSNIPTLSPRSSIQQKTQPMTPARSGLSERHDAGNIVRKPTSPQNDKPASTPSNKLIPSSPPNMKAPTGSPHKKLRMQSPQKIRERLQNEKAAIVTAHANLQDELGKIGDELSLTPSRLIPARTQTGSLHRVTGIDSGATNLAAKVLKMESALPQQINTLTEKLDTIQSDVASSLTVSENRCKKLDELYREANAENEALYSRFNSELARVLKAVRGGDGVEELKRRLQEQDEEVAKLKRENGRLKREVLGLRAQLKE